MPHYNKNYFAINVKSSTEGVVLIRRRGARISKGDYAIIFTRRGDEVEFLAVAEIADVTAKDANAGPAIALNILEKFPEPHTLDELGGSLKKVRHPLRAWKTFARQYVRLEREDFDAIRYRVINTARTVFWYVFEALPKDLQVEFSTKYAKDVRGYEFPEISQYEALTERLLQYVRGPVASALLMLREISRLSDTFESPEIRKELLQLTITDPHGDVSISLGQAARRVARQFGELFPAEQISRDRSLAVQDNGHRVERGIVLGIPDSFSKLEKEYRFATHTAGAELAVESVRKRSWHDRII